MVKKTSCYFLFIVICLLVAISCTRKEDESYITGEMSSVTHEGVLLNISSDKEIYKPGDTVNIIASAKNLTPSPIEYTLWNIGDPALYIYLEQTPFTTSQFLYEYDFEPRAVQPEVTSDFLNARQSITRRVVWDQQLSTYPKQIQAPSGKYTIRAFFYQGLDEPDKPPFELSTSIDVQIQGAWEIIEPEEAVSIARTHPEAAAWIQEHSGSGLIKFKDGQYYIHFWGWEKADQFFPFEGMTLEEFIQEYEPDYSVWMVDDTWVVRFFTKLGESPNEIMVKVDPTTGTILSFEVP